MAFATQDLVPINTADADFRAWGSALSAQLAAMGLVKTADTGQIDWSTVLKPAAGNTVQGYEIWRFNDSLQATRPVFLKIEYGSGSQGQLTPSIWLTVGSGSNGSGTLTGNLSTRAQINSLGSNSAAHTCYFSGSTNRIAVAMFTGTANTNRFFAFGVERVRDENGNETTDVYICGHAYSATNNFAGQLLPFSGAIPAILSPPPAFVPSVTGLTYGTDVGLGYMPPQKGRALPPSMNFLLYNQSSLGGGVQFSTTYYGAAHNYISLFHNGFSIFDGTWHWAMRYE